MSKYIYFLIMISVGVIYSTPKSYAEDKASHLYVKTSSDEIFYYPLQQSPVVTFEDQSLSLFIKNQKISFQFTDISSIGYVADSEISHICPIEDFHSSIKLTSRGFYIQVPYDETLYVYNPAGLLITGFHIKSDTLEFISFEDFAKGTYICTFANHVFKFHKQ